MGELLNKQFKFSQMFRNLTIEADKLGYKWKFGDLLAKTGHKKNSNHYIGLAGDLLLFSRDGTYLTTTKDYEKLGLIWESWGGSWGGRYSDGNHFSLEHEGRE